MTTQEFIEKKLQGLTRKDSCGSVLAYDNHNGLTFYSYGTHYPLLKVIDGKAFVNDSGYSMTTSRHISWAKSAAASVYGWDNVYGVPTGNLHRSTMMNSITETMTKLAETMASKKRKDTKVFEWLEYDYNKLADTLSVVTALPQEA